MVTLALTLFAYVILTTPRYRAEDRAEAKRPQTQRASSRPGTKERLDPRDAFVPSVPERASAGTGGGDSLAHVDLTRPEPSPTEASPGKAQPQAGGQAASRQQAKKRPAAAATQRKPSSRLKVIGGTRYVRIPDLAIERVAARFVLNTSRSPDTSTYRRRLAVWLRVQNRTERPYAFNASRKQVTLEVAGRRLQTTVFQPRLAGSFDGAGKPIPPGKSRTGALYFTLDRALTRWLRDVGGRTRLIITEGEAAPVRAIMYLRVEVGS